jgi:type II secretory ATPase GspE/PulE/Tfp pilus assembly ATPase PilB-like protein
MGIYEMMDVTPAVRRMVHAGAPTHELRETLKQHGHLSLRDEGVVLALEGKTTLEEVLRVTQNDDETLAEEMRRDAA